MMLDVIPSRFVRFAGFFFCLAALNAAAQPTGTTPPPPNQPVPPPPAFRPLPPPPTAAVPPRNMMPPQQQHQPSPLDTLHWDSVMKEQTTTPGQATAEFDFNVSNPTLNNVLIDHVQTSCGCTVARLPAQPWILTPNASGKISVTVNLAGKRGTFWKTVTVYSTNNIMKILSVKVTMPDNPEEVRLRNRAMAASDPQKIFHDAECAKCHVDKSRGLMGKALYKEACGICHDSPQRATMVPDLHALNKGGYDYWMQIITYGKPNSMMPGFSNKHGGPLSDEQVESLAKVLTLAFSPGAPVPATPVKTGAANSPVQQTSSRPHAPAGQN